jgi:hypothetical protein
VVEALCASSTPDLSSVLVFSFCLFLHHPVGLGRGAQPKTDQGERLSERSEFELDPVFGEHRRLPGAKRKDPDHRVAFSFAYFYFGDAKEK